MGPVAFNLVRIFPITSVFLLLAQLLSGFLHIGEQLLLPFPRGEVLPVLVVLQIDLADLILAWLVSGPLS